MITGNDLRTARRASDLTLKAVALAGGISAGHLSRVEAGEREVTPALIVLYERATGRPVEASPDDRPTPTVSDVRRRSAFQLAGATLASSFGTGQEARESDEVTACAQWLAWELWHRDLPAMPESDVPAELRPAVARLVQQLQLVRDPDGGVRFAHAGLVDFHIAARVYGGIATGSRELLGRAQTSHATDQVIREYVAQDPQSARSLSAWMASGSSPVLRVNAAGILAKVPSATLADSVISTLRRDEPARHLYLTAVAHRVLRVPWIDAQRIASAPAEGATVAEPYSARLAGELRNPRDAAARWCSAVLLHDLGLADHQSVRAAVADAIHTESARENLRTMAALLAGVSPVTA
ncbi:helix-turn-helix domain-containing protein [Catellatospora methionotrophica]|uniref:helix-turn-helix domain-containing protein n=1 Tax=Catellatospora methionotrophica TaxID=121620 RepID=UPI0033CEBFDA